MDNILRTDWEEEDILRTRLPTFIIRHSAIECYPGDLDQRSRSHVLKLQYFSCPFAFDTLNYRQFNRVVPVWRRRPGSDVISDIPMLLNRCHSSFQPSLVESGAFICLLGWKKWAKGGEIPQWRHRPESDVIADTSILFSRCHSSFPPSLLAIWVFLCLLGWKECKGERGLSVPRPVTSLSV